MARPIKDGVDYFPKNTDFYQDDKVRLLRARFGAKGMYLLDYLLCELYGKNGYYIEWNDCKCFLVSDGAGCGCGSGFVQEFITGCLQCAFFDEGVFNAFGVLTSAGIQRRYIRMFNRREELNIIKEYCLLDISDKKDVPAGVLDKLVFKSIIEYNNPDNAVNNPDKSTGNPQNKINENKVSNERYMSLLAQVVKKYESSFGRLIGGGDRLVFESLVKVYDIELIERAIDIAASNGAYSAAYIRTVLQKWNQEGISSMEDLRRRGHNRRRNEGLPDYTDVSRYDGEEDS